MIGLYIIYNFINNTENEFKYLQILICCFIFLNNFNIISDIINKDNNNAYGVSSILLFMIPCHYMVYYKNLTFHNYILCYLQCATSYIYTILRQNHTFFQSSNDMVLSLENKLIFLHIKYIYNVIIFAVCFNKYLNIYLLYVIGSIISLIEESYNIPFHEIIPFIFTIKFVYDDHTRLQYLLPGCLTMIKSKLYNHELTIIETFICHYSAGHAIFYCFL